MGPAVGAEQARVGQRTGIPPVGLPLARAGGVHGHEAGVGDNDSWLNPSTQRATHSLSVEASSTIRARGRSPSTAAKRPGSVWIRSSISSPHSTRIQIWLSFLWTSMPIWSMAGLPSLRC